MTGWTIDYLGSACRVTIHQGGIARVLQKAYRWGRLVGHRGAVRIRQGVGADD